MFFSIRNRVYSDRFELDLSDEFIRIQKFHFRRKYMNGGTTGNCYSVEKRIVSKISQTSFPNFDQITLAVVLIRLNCLLLYFFFSKKMSEEVIQRRTRNKFTAVIYFEFTSRSLYNGGFGLVSKACKVKLPTFRRRIGTSFNHS